MNDVDRCLLALAADQHGILTLADLATAGLSQSGVRRRVGSGFLVRLGPRTYCVGGHVPPWRSLLRAGLADLGPHAAVGGLASGALLGLDGLVEGVVEFVVPRAQRNRSTVGPVRSVSQLAVGDVVSVAGIRCLSATRCLIEIAPRVSDEVLGTALASACRLRLTAVTRVEARLAELARPGLPGAGRLHRLLRDGPVESWLERRFVKELRRSGLPMPLLQRVYRSRDGAVMRVDADFSPLPVVVEVGGRLGYLDPVERRRKERRRNELQRQGKVIYFFTTEDVRDGPEDVLSTLRVALTQHGWSAVTRSAGNRKIR